MNVQATLGLTPLELDILNHRLGVPDALAEVLAEEGYNAEDVLVVVDWLAKGRMAQALAVSKPLTHSVLADAVDGSTYLGAASMESKQRQVAIYRAGESLACKVGRYIGAKLVYPAY